MKHIQYSSGLEKKKDLKVLKENHGFKKLTDLVNFNQTLHCNVLGRPVHYKRSLFIQPCQDGEKKGLLTNPPDPDYWIRLDCYSRITAVYNNEVEKAMHTEIT